MSADVHPVLSVSLCVLKATHDEDVYIGLTISVAHTVDMWGHTDCGPDVQRLLLLGLKALLDMYKATESRNASFFVYYRHLAFIGRPDNKWEFRTKKWVERRSLQLIRSFASFSAL